MLEESKCEVCQKPANHKCGGCHEVFYCGREHQKAGWKTHKKCCRPFKVSCNNSLIISVVYRGKHHNES